MIVHCITPMLTSHLPWLIQKSFGILEINLRVLLAGDAQINNCRSICNLIFTYTRTLFSQTERCSWHLFSAVVGYRIFSHAQNVTSLSGLRRSSNIAASDVLTVLLLSSLLSMLIILHRLNLQKLFCITLYVLPTQL